MIHKQLGVKLIEKVIDKQRSLLQVVEMENTAIKH